MSIDSDAVLREALALPSPERAAVAAELIASLDDDDAVDDPDAVRAAWNDEIEARARRARSGDDAGEPWPALRDRLRNQLTQ